MNRWLKRCLVCLALAVGAFLLAREQDRIRNLYGPEPQTISVAQLIERGYGDNVWLDLTGVEFGAKAVIQTQTRGDGTVVWFPVFPVGRADAVKSIDVILRSTRCRDDADIRRTFAPRPAFRGAVFNPTLHRPYDPYRELLAESYPGLRLADTILEVDVEYTTPPSPRIAQGFHLAAGLLAACGILCGIRGLSPDPPGPTPPGNGPPDVS